jgi:hypothetical protein
MARSWAYALTGSVVANELAPSAPTAMVVLYVSEPQEAVVRLELLETEAGANVAIIRPFADVVYERSWISSGLHVVAASQALADCLTGPGRMPEEGRRLQEWMARNEDIWRAPMPERISGPVGS